MTESCYSNSIRNIGFITATSRLDVGRRQSEKENSTEDYVGRITAIFAPYISRNIPEGKFINLQKEVKSIITEIRGRDL